MIYQEPQESAHFTENLVLRFGHAAIFVLCYKVGTYQL